MKRRSEQTHRPVVQPAEYGNLPTPIEAEISALLQTHRTAEPVARELVARLHRGLLSEEEAADCYNFLLASGLYELFFTEMRRLLSEGAKLPWATLIEALGRLQQNGRKPESARSHSQLNSQLQLTTEDASAILEASEKQEAVAESVLSRALDFLHSGFASRRRAVADQELVKLQERKRALMTKLAYLQTNRMYEQEAEVLDELQAIFPASTEFAGAREAHDIRWARDLIARANADLRPDSDLGWKIDQLPADQKAAKNLIVSRAIEIAQADPKLAYDLSVNLHMMDFNKEALEVLQLAAATPAAEWLRLELLVRSRNFVSAIEESEHLEIAYAHEPETTFAVTYARARALHGLGQLQSAIELMRSLVRIRPHYRSAQSLLMDWSGGDS